jgi:hypothetical protein
VDDTVGKSEESLSCVASIYHHPAGENTQHSLCARSQEVMNSKYRSKNEREQKKMISHPLKNLPSYTKQNHNKQVQLLTMELSQWKTSMTKASKQK